MMTRQLALTLLSVALLLVGGGCGSASRRVQPSCVSYPGRTVCNGGVPGGAGFVTPPHLE
jgi:hypothetical protein